MLGIEDLGSAEYSVFDSPFSDMTKAEFALKYRTGINYDPKKLEDFENAPIVNALFLSFPFHSVLFLVLSCRIILR